VQAAWAVPGFMLMLSNVRCLLGPAAIERILSFEMQEEELKKHKDIDIQLQM